MDQAHQIWKEHEEKRQKNLDEWEGFTKDLNQRIKDLKVQLDDHYSEKAELSKL